MPLILIILALSLASPVVAQDRPKAEIFGGYSYLRADGGEDGGSGLHGLHVEGLGRGLTLANLAILPVGGVSRHSGSRDSSSGLKLDRTETFVAGGLCARRPRPGGYTFIASYCAQLGMAKDYQAGSLGGTKVVEGRANTFVILAGIRAAKRVRPGLYFQASGDYIHTSYGDGGQHNFRASTGLLLRLGDN